MNQKETNHSSCIDLFTRLQKEERKVKEKKDYLIEKEDTQFAQTEQVRSRISAKKEHASRSLKEWQISKKIPSSETDIEGKGRERVVEQCCGASAKYLLYFLEQNPFLYKKRVKNLRLKEYLTVLRQMQALSLQMEELLHAPQLQGRKIAFNKEKKKEHKGQEEMPIDLFQRKEERLFQLDKVIRYLS